MSEVRVNNLSNENNTGGPTISGITTFSGSNFLVPPVGDTASRPDNCPSGSLRFNTDSAHLEYYRGDGIGWFQFELINPDLDGEPQGLGTRALFFGGLGPDYKNEISHITISTLGNDKEFGDTNVAKQAAGGFSSRTRGFSVGGLNNSGQFIDVIEFCTFASLGDAVDFGNLTGTKNRPAGVSDQIRGVSGGGNPNTNVIDYITMSS